MLLIEYLYAMNKKMIESVFLYEPRVLFCNAATSCIEEHGFVATRITLEEVITPISPDTLIALGLPGAGDETVSLLRAIHYLTTHEVTVVVWLSDFTGLLLPLIRCLGVSNIVNEKKLVEGLSAVIYGDDVTERQEQDPFKNGLHKKLSAVELDVLIDFARGLSASDIATRRHIAFKTVHNHKRNILKCLGFDKSSQWFGLLRLIGKLQSF